MSDRDHDIPDTGVVDLRQLRDDFVDAQARFVAKRPIGDTP